MATSTNTTENYNMLLFGFIANGVLLNLVGVLGIFGNIISIIILSRPHMRSSSNYLLLSLAVSDTLLISCCIFLFGLTGIYRYTKTQYLFTFNCKIHPQLVVYLYPVASIAQTTSTYLTLAITLERYVAVCYPIKARSLCTYSRAKFSVLLTLIFSTAINLVRFWEVRVVKDKVNTICFEISATAIRKYKRYINLYVNFCTSTFSFFLPFSYLAIFSGVIYQEVRRANRQRHNTTSSLRCSLVRRETRQVKMLLSVVVVFLFCNCLALVNNIGESDKEPPMNQLVQTSNLLITLNSSLNFIIYIILGDKFKPTLLNMFRAYRRTPSQRQNFLT